MTKPNHEAIAAENLRRQRYEFYCPRILEQRGAKAVIRPLFPRYIFILIDQIWYSLRSTRGISYVIPGTSGPATIPAFEIDKLKRNEDSNGLVCLKPPPAAPEFNKGDKLKTSDGTHHLAGQLLIYEGMAAHERVKVLASLLGRQLIVEMPRAALTAA